MKDAIKYTVIKNLEQYNIYCDKHEYLILENEEKYTDEIELLELLIEDYDTKKMKEKNEELNPVELLQSLMKDGNITQTELSKSIKVSKQIISDVLNYRRNISKSMTIKLATFFAMNQAAFSRNYALKPSNQTSANR